MTHVEVLRNKVLPRLMYEEESALRAAIAALEAIGNADAAIVFYDNSIYHADDCDPKHYGRVLILPAAAVGGG